MEKQRLMEAQRNKAALDRALAPPFRPVGRRPVFRYVWQNGALSCLYFQLIHKCRTFSKQKAPRKSSGRGGG